MVAKAEKSIKKYYNVSFAQYSGVFLQENLMKKVARLQHKHMQELKEVLASNLNELEIVNWTLAYPNGEQTSVHYFEKDTSDEEKLERIKVLRHICDVGYEKHVYEVSGGDWKENDDAVIKSFLELEGGPDEC